MRPAASDFISFYGFMNLLFSNRSYRSLFFATGISNLGDGVAALAFPWLASLITRDPLLIAAVAFANRLPWLLLTIPIGALTDRKSRKELMVYADIFRFLLTICVIGLVIFMPSASHGTHEVFLITILSCLAFLLGSAEVVRDNSAQTVLPSIVSPKDLETANGQMWSIEQIMGAFIGPPLAGVLIAIALPAPFALDAVTFGWAAYLVWHTSIAPTAPASRQSLAQSTAEAWGWMRAHGAILRLALMLGFMNLQATIIVTLLVLFAQDILILSAIGYGILLTAGAAGGVAAGLAGPKIVTRIGSQKSALLALGLFPLQCLLIATASSPFTVGFALFIGMFGALLWNVTTVSYRQRLIPNRLLGRVNSLYRFFGWGFMPVGALLGGWMVSLAEPKLGRQAALRLPFYICFGTGTLMMIYGILRCRLTKDGK